MALHLLREQDSHCSPCHLQTLISRFRNVPGSSSRLLQCCSYRFPPEARPLTSFYLRILSRISHAVSMFLQVFNCSVHQEPLGMALRNTWSCSSLSWPCLFIQCWNSLFQVKYALRDPSHVGAGSFSKPLACGFVAKFSAICFAASATDPRIAVFQRCFAMLIGGY